MMSGVAIGAQAIGDAGLRRLATEHGGPRPDGVRGSDVTAASTPQRTAIPTRP